MASTMTCRVCNDVARSLGGGALIGASFTGIIPRFSATTLNAALGHRAASCQTNHYQMRQQRACKVPQSLTRTKA
jgi:hypothetical protein